MSTKIETKDMKDIHILKCDSASYIIEFRYSNPSIDRDAEDMSILIDREELWELRNRLNELLHEGV